MVIDLPLAVGLREKYVGDNALRLQLYRLMASLADEAAVVARF